MLTFEPGFRRSAARVWAALAATTLVNTTITPLCSALGLAPGLTGELRDWILIGHAALGLAASWYIAAPLMSCAAGAAGAGLVFAVIEKGAELAGQIVIVFTVHRGWQAELARTTDAVQRAVLEARIGLFMDLWDDMFLVFWVGALLSNLCWLRAARRVGAGSRGLRIAFAVMALLALALILEGYGGQAWLRVGLPIAYPLLLTATRLWIAWSLSRHMCRQDAAAVMAPDSIERIS